MKFKYKVTPHTTGRERTVTLDFTPYENKLKDVSNTENMWTTDQNSVLQMDRRHPIIPGTAGALKLRALNLEDKETTITATLDVEIGKTYLFTTYVRNNDARSTALYVQGEYKNSNKDAYTKRVAGTFVAESEQVEVKLKLYDYNVVQSLGQSQIAWVGGEMLVEIEEEESIETLKEKYEYVQDRKESPTVRDLLNYLFHFSPYRYYLVADGRRIEHHATQLIEQGIDENTILETGIAETDEQIYSAFTADIPLMAMLEGDFTHVSHAFPKEDREMTRLHESHFPRIQFFTGFAVNRRIADTEPIAEEVNFAFNIYIPVTKVMQSVSAIMILNQSSAILAELGWSKIRGSDYFLKNEQLYVLQTQYIQDQQKPIKRN